MSETIDDDLAGIIRRVLGRPDLTVTPETTAKDVPGWDSLKQVMIILEVETHFGVTLHSREVDAIRNVGDFAALVRKKKG